MLEESLERYRRAVMANYHRLETVDNLYKRRGEILHRLDAIERDVRALEAASRWYAEQGGLDAEDRDGAPDLVFACFAGSEPLADALASLEAHARALRRDGSPGWLGQLLARVEEGAAAADLSALGSARDRFK